MDESDRERAQALFQLRWPNGLVCPCGSTGFHQLHTRPRVFQCRGCKKPHSVTANTLMHNTHLPLSAWFVAAREFTKSPGVSARELARTLEVRVETAWRLLHRIQRAVSGDDVTLLSGLCEHFADVIEVRPPKQVECAVEAVAVIDPEGHTALLAGTPTIDRAIGLEGLERMEYKYGYLNGTAGMPLHRSTPSDEARATVFASGAVTTHGARLSRAERFFAYVEERLYETHRQVSERWLDRYTRSAAWNYARWPEPHYVASPVDGVGSVLTLLLGQPRATFDALRPPWRDTRRAQRASTS